ncbi:MAG: hypothetical protein Q3991_00390 [Rothia sp. (in: high G+C Gram-positive bacteria)]|uniref:hypothetical protein n=1 Tax=Rothia sp. (in: high G+C Gram-positive bacteria) TaxID=1885016 RepID=UPI0026DD6063|nr:hypothetical protein [Rothia sp. (in: high G+C Gram-positive bacteria)]MDO4883385.1 hypothetical protein [Rothia sp. (in: high G+C Gram-positive bacteria)]
MENLTGRIANAANLIDGMLGAGSIHDYTSREQLTFMREQLAGIEDDYLALLRGARRHP